MLRHLVIAKRTITYLPEGKVILDLGGSEK